MFDFRLLFHLIPHFFSLQKGHLRYPTPKRILIVAIFIPLFLILSLIHGLFFLLDEVLFPGYRRQSVRRAAFITGVPRSATTFVFQALMDDDRHFTGFTMGEALFAPSATQKVLLLPFIFLDKKTGGKLKKAIARLDDVIFGNFRDIHDSGLVKPEEDEFLLLFIFGSSYLWFFFPDTADLEAYLYFDERLPEKKRLSIMRHYRRCVQKHNYIFNRQEDRVFISKNPTFTPKMQTLCKVFPEGKIIYMLRSPYKTIPATISLCTHLYQGLCNVGEEPPLAARTRDMVLDWYEMSEKMLETSAAGRHRIVPVEDLARDPHQTMVDLYDFLEVEPDEHIEIAEQQSRAHKSKHRYDPNVGIDEELIESRMGPYKRLLSAARSRALVHDRP